MTTFPHKRTNFTHRASALAALVAVLITATAVGEEQTLTLDSCVQRAVVHSAGLLGNQHDIRSARAGVNKAAASLLPSLTGALTAETLYGKPASPFSLASQAPPEEGGSGSTTPVSLTTRTVTTDKGNTITTTTPKGGTRQTANSSSGIVTSTTLRAKVITTVQVRALEYPSVGLASAQVNYPIFGQGSLFGLNHPPTVELARAFLDQQVWAGQLSRAQLVNTVENAYLTIAWAEDQAKIDHSIQTDLEQLITFSKEQVRLHLDLPVNLTALEKELTSAKTHLLETETLLRSAHMQLARLIGRNDKEPMHLVRVKARPLPAISDLYAQTIGKHPQVHVQQTTADQAHQNYRIARSAEWPTVSLQSTWTAADDLVHSEQDLWSGALTVAVPIFNFGALNAATKQALETWKAETARTQQAKDDVLNAMATAYASIEEYQLIVVATDRQIADAEASLKVLQGQQAQGILSAQPVLQAELQLLGLKETRNVNEFHSRLFYSSLNLAAGGNWKWTE